MKITVRIFLLEAGKLLVFSQPPFVYLKKDLVCNHLEMAIDRPTPIASGRKAEKFK